MSVQGKILTALGLCLLIAATTGCGRDMDDLQSYVAEVKGRPGGRIEPLPEISPYESHEYSVMNLRPPFTPDAPVAAAEAASGIRPNRNRSREFLEQFPLDTLNMVGTLQLAGRQYGLVQTSDGLIHRVVVGNYMGQNDGKVVSINESEITLVEIIPDGLGGYLERPAAVALSD